MWCFSLLAITANWVSIVSTSDHQKVLYLIYMLHIVLISEYVQWTFIKRHTSPRGTTYEDAMLTMWFFVGGHNISDLRADHWYHKWKKWFLAPPGSCGGAHVRVSEPAGGLVLRWVHTQEESSIGTHWGQIRAYQTTTDRRACSHWNSGPIMPVYVCIDVLGQWTCQH